MSSDVLTGATTPEEKTPGRLGRIYQGRTTVDFVCRKRTWFCISVVIIVLGLGSLGIRGFNLGIDFKGGSSWEVLAPHSSISAMTSAVKAGGLSNPSVVKLGSQTYEVSADVKSLSTTAQTALSNKVSSAMAKQAGTNANQVS